MNCYCNLIVIYYYCILYICNKTLLRLELAPKIKLPHAFGIYCGEQVSSSICHEQAITQRTVWAGASVCPLAQVWMGSDDELDIFWECSQVVLIGMRQNSTVKTAFESMFTLF